MADIFLSYAREEQDRAIPIVRGLESMGHSVFYDDRVPGGVDWSEFIQKELDAARCMIVAFSPAARASKWVKREVMTFDRRNQPIVPIMIEEVGLPLWIVEKQWIDFKKWDRDYRDASWVRLVETLDRHLPPRGLPSPGTGDGPAPSQPAPPVATPEPPSRPGAGDRPLDESRLAEERRSIAARNDRLQAQARDLYLLAEAERIRAREAYNRVRRVGAGVSES